LNRGLGGSQNRSVRGGEEKNSQPLPLLEPPIIQQLAVPLSYPVSYMQRVDVVILYVFLFQFRLTDILILVVSIYQASLMKSAPFSAVVMGTYYNRDI
jgi:hypothetical protein